MRDSKKLALEYLKTTDLHSTGIYKLQPLQTIFAAFEWLKEKEKENGKDNKKENK